MIKFEANNNKVNWYSEAELQALIPKLIAQMNATAAELSAIKSKLGIGTIAAIDKNNNANTYLNGAGNWSTVSSGTSYSIGNNISNNNGTISVADANASTKGVTKLYTSTGTATDGTMTQAAIKTELDKKISSSTKVAEAIKADSATKLATAQTINGVPFDGSKNIIFGGICTTAADVAEKTVAIDNFQESNYAVVHIFFQYGNTAANPTLKINDGVARKIQWQGSNIKNLHINAGHAVSFLRYSSTWKALGFPNSLLDLQPLENVNANEITTPGFYALNEATNVPLKAGFLIVSQSSVNDMALKSTYQLFFTGEVSGVSANDKGLYYRIAQGDTAMANYATWFKITAEKVT